MVLLKSLIKSCSFLPFSNFIVITTMILAFAVFCCPGEVRAEEEEFSSKLWRQARVGESKQWTREPMLPKLLERGYLEGLERKKVHEMLGSPELSDQILPGGDHQSTVDHYLVSSKNDQHLCLQFDNRDKVISIYVESSPLILPNYGGKGRLGALLRQPELDAFLSGRTEETVLRKSVSDLERMLGAPSKVMKNRSQSAGRDWRWLIYVYQLSPDGAKAILFTFNADSGKMHEYRVQTLLALDSPDSPRK